MSPFHQHITSLWILHFSVYSEMEIACHVREYSDGCSPFMLECKFLTKRWFHKAIQLCNWPSLVEIFQSLKDIHPSDSAKMCQYIFDRTLRNRGRNLPSNSFWINV